MRWPTEKEILGNLHRKQREAEWAAATTPAEKRHLALS